MQIDLNLLVEVIVELDNLDDERRSINEPNGRQLDVNYHQLADQMKKNWKQLLKAPHRMNDDLDYDLMIEVDQALRSSGRKQLARRLLSHCGDLLNAQFTEPKLKTTRSTQSTTGWKPIKKNAAADQSEVDDDQQNRISPNQSPLSFSSDQYRTHKPNYRQFPKQNLQLSKPDDTGQTNEPPERIKIANRNRINKKPINQNPKPRAQPKSRTKSKPIIASPKPKQSPDDHTGDHLNTMEFDQRSLTDKSPSPAKQSTKLFTKESEQTFARLTEWKPTNETHRQTELKKHSLLIATLRFFLIYLLHIFKFITHPFEHAHNSNRLLLKHTFSDSVFRLVPPQRFFFDLFKVN